MGSWRDRIFEQHRWVGYLLPIVVFSLSGQLEPPREGASPAGARRTSIFAWVYAVRMLLTSAAIVLVWPVFREFGGRVTPLGLWSSGLWAEWLGFGFAGRTGSTRRCRRWGWRGGWTRGHARRYDPVAELGGEHGGVVCVFGRAIFRAGGRWCRSWRNCSCAAS